MFFISPSSTSQASILGIVYMIYYICIIALGYPFLSWYDTTYKTDIPKEGLARAAKGAVICMIITSGAGIVATAFISLPWIWHPPIVVNCIITTLCWGLFGKADKQIITSMRNFTRVTAMFDATVLMVAAFYIVYALFTS